MAKKRLGEILVERGAIDLDQLNSALSHQRQWGMRLGTALVDKGFVTEGLITRVLSEVMQIPMVDLAKVNIDPEALRLLKAATCEQYDVFPIAVKVHKGRNLLLLAMADPLNVAAIDEVGFTTDMTVRPAIAQASSVRAAIKVHYYGQHADIPELRFEHTSQPPQPAAPALQESMTIVGRGGNERVVTGAQPPPEVPSAQPAYAPPPVGPPVTDPFASASPTGSFPAGPFQRSETFAAAFVGQPTGAYLMPQVVPQQAAPAASPESVAQARQAEQSAHEALEKNFWAMMRVLAKKGLITKEEFLAELKND